jgi:hypothetical protein
MSINKDTSNSNYDLSSSARILRSKTSTPEERKKAAAALGSKGGSKSQTKPSSGNPNKAKPS